MSLDPHGLLRLALAEVTELSAEGSKAPALAKRLGLPYPRVYKWVENGKAPDAAGCLRILERFGWLNIDANARAAAAIPDDPLERIAAGVAEILALLNGENESEQPESQAAAKPTRGKRRR